MTTLGLTNVLVGVAEQNALTNMSPRRRDILTADWSDSRWNLLTRLTRHGETTRVEDFGGGFTPTQTYGAVYQLDAEIEYKADKALSLAVGGINLTNRYPDRSSSDINYFGHFPYDFVSPIGINGAYYYSRLRYTF